MSGAPSAESQIVFLKKIQTLFDDSSFNATYKFALLITLADLAIEHGDDSGNPLELKGKLIATRFAEIYWPQIKQYSTGISGTTSGVLVKTKAVRLKSLLPCLAFKINWVYMTFQKSSATHFGKRKSTQSLETFGKTLSFTYKTIQISFCTPTQKIEAN